MPEQDSQLVHNEKPDSSKDAVSPLAQIVDRQQQLYKEISSDPSFMASLSEECITPLILTGYSDDFPYLPADISAAAITLFSNPDALMAFDLAEDTKTEVDEEEQTFHGEYIPTYQQELSAAIQLVRNFLNDQSAIPFSVPAIRLANDIEYVQNSLRILIHYYDVLQRSGVCLSELAPKLESLITEILAHTLLLQQHDKVGSFPQIGKILDRKWSSTGNLTVTTETNQRHLQKLRGLQALEKWAYGNFDQLHGIVVDDAYRVQKDEVCTPLQVIACGHELVHAVFHSLMNPHTTDIQELQDLNIKNANIWKTLNEAVSLAFEHELISMMLGDPNVSLSNIEEITSYARERLVYLRKANTYWLESVRNAFVPDQFLSPPDPDNIDDISYSDGARLAIRLRRSGWTLNELPELIKQIRTLLVNEHVPVDRTILSTIGASRQTSASRPEADGGDDNFTLYYRLLQKIGKLRPKQD